MAKEPLIYEKCFVIWDGKAVNITINSLGQVQFTLLVGYTDGSYLDGQVPVVLDELISIPADRPLRIFGEVFLLENTAEEGQAKASGDEPRFFIKAKTIQPLK